MNLTFFKVEGRDRYDKLQPARFRQGNTFTTFRAYSPHKDKYYSEVIGKEFYVIYDTHAIGKAKLIKRDYQWSDELSIEEIENDTFSDWTRVQFDDLMYRFYENRRVFGFWLTFQITKVGTNMKTLDSFEGGENRNGDNV